jgi:hypothetical protein
MVWRKEGYYQKWFFPLLEQRNQEGIHIQKKRSEQICRNRSRDILCECDKILVDKDIQVLGRSFGEQSETEKPFQDSSKHYRDEDPPSRIHWIVVVLPGAIFYWLIDIILLTSFFLFRRASILARFLPNKPWTSSFCSMKAVVSQQRSKATASNLPAFPPTPRH